MRFASSHLKPPFCPALEGLGLADWDKNVIDQGGKVKSLDGKIALVTGASGGIGRQIAVRLAESGVTIIAHFRSREECAEETASAVRAVGSEIMLVKSDLSQSEGVRDLFAEVDKAFAAPLDILVNNAGAGSLATIAAIDDIEIERLFRVNLKATVLLTQQALTRFNDGGAIVNITSMSGLMAQPAGFAYGMCKAALNSFTVSLAAELSSRKIRVNAVAPGPTDTDLLNDYRANESAMDLLTGMAALGRLGTPDDIARIVRFLASPESGWLTGQILQASGGMRL
ncbi:SDR family oxidoreductase [Aquamicrobium sp.]|uniref:SDR family NAD(P)-dependent oxidoreductase n=1 Tax=Aquamicrobium sp. TaxID=1872579 RepID=UPI002582CE2B|nr:SDR family oxidoreductase [Aquamicrobium sp.]MCK9554115.1 SDR family oxidoreductase [Aquamicrobium sp.]